MLEYIFMLRTFVLYFLLVLMLSVYT